MIDLEAAEVYGGSLADGITEATWSPSGLRFALWLANGKVRIHDRLTGGGRIGPTRVAEAPIETSSASPGLAGPF